MYTPSPPVSSASSLGVSGPDGVARAKALAGIASRQGVAEAQKGGYEMTCARWGRTRLVSKLPRPSFGARPTPSSARCGGGRAAQRKARAMPKRPGAKLKILAALGENIFHTTKPFKCAHLPAAAPPARA